MLFTNEATSTLNTNKDHKYTWPDCHGGQSSTEMPLIRDCDCSFLFCDSTF